VRARGRAVPRTWYRIGRVVEYERSEDWRRTDHGASACRGPAVDLARNPGVVGKAIPLLAWVLQYLRSERRFGATATRHSPRRVIVQGPLWLSSSMFPVLQGSVSRTAYSCVTRARFSCCFSGIPRRKGATAPLAVKTVNGGGCLPETCCCALHPLFAPLIGGRPKRQIQTSVVAVAFLGVCV
jgi:hypothetical protein